MMPLAQWYCLEIADFPRSKTTVNAMMCIRWASPATHSAWQGLHTGNVVFRILGAALWLVGLEAKPCALCQVHSQRSHFIASI